MLFGVVPRIGQMPWQTSAMGDTEFLTDDAGEDAGAQAGAQLPGGHRRFRLFAHVAAAVSLAAVLVPVAARLTGWEPGPIAWLVSLMPWVTLACVIPVAFAMLARSGRLTVAAVLPLALCVAWVAPLCAADGAPADATAAPVLRVATINLTFGQADADAVVRLVVDRSIDVLALQELTPRAVEALREAGLDDAMPYSEVRAEQGFAGTGLWSRQPFAAAESLDELESRAVRVEISVAGAPLAIYAVHPMAPGVADHSLWVADMGALAALLTPRDGAVLVAGDFNATRDHRSFRALEDLGFVDAADEAGAGFLPTFPEGRLPMPIVAIDHVITRDAPLIAVDVATVAIVGADHRALVVTYADA